MTAMLCLASAGALTKDDNVPMALNLARCTVHSRVPTRTLRLRGGAAPEGIMQARPQPMEDGNRSEGPQGPDFTRGFLDNGVSYAEQFAEQLKERRRMGHNIPVPTPAMFQGDDEGVSFDANGNFQLAPPGYTPEEAMEVIRKESQELADMGIEEYRDMIQKNLDEHVRPHIFDPMNYVLQSGGFKHHPEHLEPVLKMTEWSIKFMQDAGFTLDEETLEWTPPKDNAQRRKEEELRQLLHARRASHASRPVLDLIDDTDPTDIARPVA